MADYRTEGRLAPLGELADFRVAPGNPDIRGWGIYGLDDAHLGDVVELIVDTGVRKARYLVAAVGRSFLGLARRREVLVPLGRARLDDVRDRVYLDGLTVANLSEFPQYDEARLDREREREIFGDAEHLSADHDPHHFLGKRRAGDEYIVLHGETLPGEGVSAASEVEEPVPEAAPVEPVPAEERPAERPEVVSKSTRVSTDSFGEVEAVVIEEEVVVRRTRIESALVEPATEGLEEDVEVPPKKEPV